MSCLINEVLRVVLKSIVDKPSTCDKHLILGHERARVEITFFEFLSEPKCAEIEAYLITYSDPHFACFAVNVWKSYYIAN